MKKLQQLLKENIIQDRIIEELIDPLLEYRIEGQLLNNLEVGISEIIREEINESTR